MRKLKPTKLPPNPTFIDRLEYGAQWVISWLVIDIPGRPCISGLLTSLLMIVPIFSIATVIGLVLGALLNEILQGLIEEKPNAASLKRVKGKALVTVELMTQ